MSVKSWGDTWVVELLPPRTTSFFSLCIYRLWMVTSSCIQQHGPSSQLLRVFLHSSVSVSQVLGTWSLKADSHQRMLILCETTNGGPGQELGNELKNGWRVSRLQTQFWWATMASQNLELRLHRHQLVLTEHLPGEAIYPRVLWESK